MLFARSVTVLLLSMWAGVAQAGQDPSPVHPAYVGTAVCSSCHEAEASSWETSHHAHAWMEPGPETVDGDFDNAEFTHMGRTTRFTKENGDYFIETDDVAGARHRFRVIGVDGIAPLQQYLVETEPGRVQSFDVVWDQEKKGWYHLYGEDAPPPGDGLHWTGPYKNWNGRCAECHATGFEKNYEIATRRYSSRQAEKGVGCEACHGPGEAHVAWARGGREVPQSPFPGLDATGFAISLKENSAETEIQQCAGCHSRREAFQDGNPLPGTPFHDAYRLSLLSERLYHADGQILDEVYVYGSFLQSKMYANGVRCSNCHEPHSGSLKASGNGLCTQCHSPAGNEAFPTLAKKAYDDPAHHFHEEGTPGAECKSCHMIERVYMGIDGRRDHSFRVPRPDLSARIGTPNACNDCHADKGPGWAAAELEKRFPGSKHRGPHYGEVFAAARGNADGIGPELLEIARLEMFPGIVRATALDLLTRNADPSIAGDAAGLISDADPLVRAAAVSLQQRAQGPDRLQRIIPALSDPVMSVRIAAARLLIGLPVAHLPERIARAAGGASGEWRQSLGNKTDFPEAHLVIGGTALAARNIPAAVAAFEEVTRLDPQMVDAWIMQVRIKAATGDMSGAQLSLQKALLANPGNPNLEAYRSQFSQ